MTLANLIYTRFFAIGLLSSFLGCIFPVFAHAESPASRPNFLVIITDDQSYETIHALSGEKIETPNLDRLVAQGTSFKNCYNQGAWQGAVCIASRTMLISGKTLFHSQKDEELHSDRYSNIKERERKKKLGKKKSRADTENPQATLSEEPAPTTIWPEAFKNAGYTTYLVGKWHNSKTTLLRGFSHGSSIAGGMLASIGPDGDKKAVYNRSQKDDSWEAWNPAFTGHWAPKLRNIETVDGVNKISADYDGDKHSTELFADRAISYLKKEINEDSKPFFFFLSFNAPHDPRQAPKEYLDRYPIEKQEVPANFLPEYPFDNGSEAGRDEELGPFPRTKEAVQLHRAEYYAIITHMDHEIGRVLKALEDSGKADNTYIIFTSDHGLALGRHGLFGKQNLYEHSLKAPLVITGPGVPANKTCDALVYLQGLFETTCDLAGLSTPETVQFNGFSSLVKNPAVTDESQNKGESHIFGSFINFQRSIRDEHYKLIVYPQGSKKQLFDLQEDPLEIVNLIDNPKYQKVYQKLAQALLKQQKVHNDALDISKVLFH